MDLSQQELPLTSYFTRKETKSCAASSRKDKSSEDSQSVGRSSKRRKSNVQCSTASPLGSSAGHAKQRPQLPTPATSARKRTRNGRLESQTKTVALSSYVGQNASKGLTQLESEPTPSKVPQFSREGAELSGIPLAIPSTGRPGPRHPNYSEAGIATPQTLSRRISQPVHGVGHSPLTRSSCALPTESSRFSPRLTESAVSHAVLSHVQHSTRSIVDFPSLLGDSDGLDPFFSHEKDKTLEQHGISAPLKQGAFQILDGQPSNGPAIPMMPVPSSQSQYLLHPDATPKRKRCFQRIEHVVSSQTQEERELSLSTPHRRTAMTSSSVAASPGK